MTPTFEYNSLTIALLDNAFKLRGNRLLIENKFLRSLLYCQPGKPNLKFAYSDVNELNPEIYKQLFNKGDEDKILKYFSQRDKKEISIKEARAKFKYTLMQLVRNAVRQYYQYLPDYDSIGERKTESSQLFAIETALMMLVYQYREYMDDIAPILAEAKIQVDGSAFSFNKKKQELWEQWFRTYDPRLIPGMLVLPQVGKYHEKIKLPVTTRDLIALFYLRTRAKHCHFVAYQQLLTNFVIDNPSVDKNKVFMVDHDQMTVDMYWAGLEDIEVNENNVTAIRQRVEQELGLRVWLPFELVCFTLYRFEFSGVDEDNCSTWSFENYLVVYDYSTKCILYKTCLTGESSDFEKAIRALIETDFKIPLMIFVDPALTFYVEECSLLIDRLRLPIEIQSCENFRFSHFLDFYVTRKDMCVKYDITPKGDARSYLVCTPAERSYKESINCFGELVLDEFDLFDDLGSSDKSFQATPKDCFSRMKKGFSRQVLPSELALLYFCRVEAIAEKMTCRFRLAEFIFDYQLTSECFESGIVLINPNEPEADVFFLTPAGKIVEAKYRDKFLYEGGRWQDDIGCSPLKVINVTNESNRLLRKEFGIADPNKADLSGQLDKSRVIRKKFKQLKKISND